ncbi:carboxypeptidase-like regulatory domain-containing protein [Rapidithrix thailandica]|uniref:Carboxypeptidase-like regulatory domain-containing protein n=1 Tax=Rapidithrix thailandica TaxID=413964 RepID=A0AAW9RUC0_9BACT
MIFKKLLFTGLFTFLCSYLVAQMATVKGVVTDSQGNVIELATIIPKNANKGVVSNIDGRFSIQIPANQVVTLLFHHGNYYEKSLSLQLSPGELHEVSIALIEKTTLLKDVEIVEKLEKNRDEAGTVELDPASVKEVPTPFMDFNQALITGGGLGIAGNNEMSGTYSVRGGNFDENLVYVNDIQIYRPLLVKSGQQEGLSFVNPEMVDNIYFSSGGWQSKYGDKLSSVLNVAYKTPKEFEGAATLSLLGGSLNLGGTALNKKMTYVASVRHKASQYLLSSMDVDGEYLPKFTDIQTYLNFDLSNKGRPANTTTLGVLASYAVNDYEVTPHSRTTKFGTFQQALRLNVAYIGNDMLKYRTFQGGVKLRHRFSEKLTTNLIVSGLSTQERLFTNLEAGYRICDVDNNPGSSTFNDCAVIIGLGTNFNYARNFLDANIYALENRSEYSLSSSWKIDFGVRYSYEEIDDNIHEYSFIDSADYVSDIQRAISDNSLSSQRISGYLQSAWDITSNQRLVAGARINYWDFNEELLISPRIQYSLQPLWNADVVFKAAVGLYHQPPFYHELRDFEGNVNKELKAQSSLHFITGLDYNFIMWDRPFKFISEIFYKKLWNVIPYDVDNVRIRYYAENNAEAYATGIDMRLSGEFIEGLESWMSLSVLSTKEDLDIDQRGYIRRPMDQRVTFSMFFQDHIPNDPSIRMHIRTIYGTGFPYGPPDNLEYRQSLNTGNSYTRVDVGFSKLISFQKSSRQDNFLESIWLGLEILNLFGVDNTISHTWVKDFNNTFYAVPNNLSQRFFNLKFTARW